MSGNPLNLLLRFLLELAALAGFGYAGSTLAHGVARAGLIAAFVVVPAAVWGVFRMANDGGPPVIEVGGRVRLALEIVFFTGAWLGLGLAGAPTPAVVLAGITVIHYALGYDRVGRMLRCRT